MWFVFLQGMLRVEYLVSNCNGSSPPLLADIVLFGLSFSNSLKALKRVGRVFKFPL